MKIRPKNWQEFQHYKDRSPPWIKLHRKLLDDRAFNALPLASKALAPFLWLLASESKDGWFDGSAEEITFRLRWKLSEVQTGLKHLISSGFFEVERAASTPIAQCLEIATPERETETQVKTERETDSRAKSRFGEFWLVYPRRVGKAKAQQLFDKLAVKDSADLIIAAAGLYATKQADVEEKYIAHAATWLNGRRWEDEDVGQVIRLTAFNSPEELEGQRLAKERLYGKAGN